MYRIPRVSVWLSHCSLGLVTPVLASQELVGSRIPGHLRLALCSSSWYPHGYPHACFITRGRSQLPQEFTQGHLNSLSHPGYTMYQRSTCLAQHLHNPFTFILSSVAPQSHHPGPSFPPILISGANQWTALLCSEEEVPPGPPRFCPWS